MRVVLDTNVIVSGLLSPGGFPARVLDLLSDGRIVVLFDDRMLREYRDVLPRAKLKLDVQVVRSVLEYIELEGLLVSAAPLSVVLPDPTDLPFIEVAAAGGTTALVTGNTRHFAPARHLISVPIVSPAGFVDLWLRAAAEGG